MRAMLTDRLAAAGLTLLGRIPTIRRMDEDLQALAHRIDRLLESMHRLTDDNLALRSELARSHARQADLESRISEARTRVQATLDRIPGGVTTTLDTPVASAPDAVSDDHQAAH
jgi:uncharacterized protein (TIGR02449 family)